MNKLILGFGAMAALNLAVLAYTLNTRPSGDEAIVAQTQIKDAQACNLPAAYGIVGGKAAISGQAPGAPKRQAFFDPGKQQEIIRVGIQKTDCGCCGALQEQLQADGFAAQFSYTTPTNDLNITEHTDRCRMITIDGVPFTGYDTKELSKIVGMKFRGDMPGHLASTRNYADVDPRQARPMPGEKSLIVTRDQIAIGSQ